MTIFFANRKDHATAINNCERENAVTDKERQKIIQQRKVLPHMQRKIQ